MAQVFSFDIFLKVVSGGISILLIRILPEQEYASFVFALAFTTLMMGTLVSGFNRVYIVAYERLNIRNSSSFLGLQISAILVVALLLVPVSTQFEGLYLLAVLLALGNCLVEFARTVFQHELKFFWFSMVEALRTVIYAVALLILFLIVRWQIHASDVLLLQSVITLTVFVIFLGRRIDRSIFRLREAIRLAKGIIFGSYRYLFIYFFLLAFFVQVDVFVLKAISTDTQLATYGSAFRYYSVLVLALNSFHTVLLPTIQRINTKAELKEIYDRHLKAVVIFIPGIALVAWASQWIIPAIDQGRYPDAVLTFQILAVSAAFSLLFSPHVNLLMRFEDFRFLLLLLIVCLVLVIILNFVLVPSYGAIGSAISMAAGFITINIVIFLRSERLRKTRSLSESGIATSF